MSETLDPVATELDQRQLAEQLLEQAKEQGIELVGPNGLLGQLTKNVLETALDAEMGEHLGYEKHDSAGRNSGNSRNGTRAKTVLTEIGPVEIEVPRDTNSSVRAADRQEAPAALHGGRRDRVVADCEGVDDWGDRRALRRRVRRQGIQGHDQPDHRESHRRDDRVVNRPLEKVYPVMFIDAMFVKVRDGQVANRPVYVVIGVTWTASATSSGCGRATAVRARSSGWRVDRDQEPRYVRRVHRGL